jgi:hypothetical protein
MSEKVTICVQCKHLILCGDSKSDWSYLCKKAERIRSIDPVTGKTMYSTKNDLGHEYFTESKYDFCRNVNKGNCKDFEKK